MLPSTNLKQLKRKKCVIEQISYENVVSTYKKKRVQKYLSKHFILFHLFLPNNFNYSPCRATLQCTRIRSLRLWCLWQPLRLWTTALSTLLEGHSCCMSDHYTEHIRSAIPSFWNFIHGSKLKIDKNNKIR